MGLNFRYTDGQTPLDEEEKAGLRIHTISTKGELDEFEQQNIEEALQWVYGRKLNAAEVFNEKFIGNLHRRMFGEVWTWAGKYRKTEKNLGIPFHRIPVEVRKLCDDAMTWYENDSYPPDEQALRFKHRVVSIHCFSNGNGRHSRLMADIIATKVFDRDEFNWGAGNLSQKGDARQMYLSAVKAADRGDFRPLLVFARS